MPGGARTRRPRKEIVRDGERGQREDRIVKSVKSQERTAGK
jgi:hypothetical protein